MTDVTSTELLSMHGIVKRFPGVVALGGVSLRLFRGEILSLMGENGAGKSTLMKILGGAYKPDEGEIRISGRIVQFQNVKDAKRLGIALIHQELMLAPNLSIASNIFLGNENRGWGLFSKLNRREMNAKARELLMRVGLRIDPSVAVFQLTAGQMQMVEIAKALLVNARIIIMDEPTSSLTAGESKQLFQIIRQLKSEGIGIIYISHRMDEVLALSDRVTVLRDGKYVGELSAAEATHDKIVSLMVGREFTHRFPEKPPREMRKDELIIENIVVPGTRSGISFSAKKGEILGFAGLVGAGRTELMQTIFGVKPALSGRMLLQGHAYSARNPRDAIARGVYLAPEDRKRHGVVLPMNVVQNISLPDISNYAPAGFLNRSRESIVADVQVASLRIKTPTTRQKVANLSGGNQQKIVIGKWLAMYPKILILDEPTRGIDVGAKAEIYQQMTDLAARGVTILMVSSDMEEIIGISDRVVVMHEQEIKGILNRNELSEEKIASLMTGKK